MVARARVSAAEMGTANPDLRSQTGVVAGLRGREAKGGGRSAGMAVNRIVVAS